MFGSGAFWLYATAALGLVVFAGIVLAHDAGLMSGLTVGLMSLSVMNLEILKNSGTDTQSSHAKKILPIVKRHHLLLVRIWL